MGDQPNNSSAITKNPAGMADESWRGGANFSESGETRPGRSAWVTSIDDGLAVFIRSFMALIGMGFFFGLPLFALYGHELGCSDRYLLFGPFVFGGLVTGYYFGSQISLAGQTKLSPTTSLQINAVGSVAFAILAGWYGYRIFLPKTCEVPRSYVRILGLPLTAQDVSPDSIFNKHWQPTPDELVFDYEFEISSLQDLPIRMKISKDASSFFCILNVHVDTQDFDPKAEFIDKRNSEAIYKIQYDPSVESAGNGSGGTGDKENCFASSDPALGDKKIQFVRLAPNGAKLLDNDKIKAAIK